MGTPRRDYVEQYWDQGYAVLRGFLPKAALGELQAETRRLYAEGLKHPTTYRDRNLLFEVLPDSFRGQRYLLQADADQMIAQADASDILKARPVVPTTTVVEYYWAAKDHYF